MEQSVKVRDTRFLIKSNRVIAGSTFSICKAHLIEGDGSWSEIKNADTLLPHNGSVFLWDPTEEDRRVEKFIHATIEENPGYKPGPKHHQYQVAERFAAYEFIPLIGSVDESTATSILLETGLNFSAGPLDNIPLGEVIYQISESTWIGPLKLSKSEDGKGWIFKGANDSLMKIPRVKVDAQSIIPVNISGKKRYMLGPRAAVPTRIGVYNLQPFHDLVTSMYRRLSKVDLEFIRSLDVTEKIFMRYRDKLRDSELHEADPEIVAAQAKRLELFLSVLSKNASMLDTIIKESVALPAVSEGLESEKRSALERYLESEKLATKKSIEDETKPLRTQKEKLETALITLKNSVKAKNLELARISTELKTFEGEFASALKKEVTRINTKASDSFATAAAFNALFSATQIDGFSAPNFPSVRVLKEEVNSNHCPTISTSSEIRRALSEAAISHGISGPALTMAAAAALSGNMPVIYGPEASSIVRALSDCLSGGRIIRIPIPANLYGLDPILNALENDPAFSDYLPRAAIYPPPTILFLEGINRSPYEAYLKQIVEVFARTRRLNQPNDLHCSIGKFFWPSNLLLVSTIIDGQSTFSLPESSMDHIVLVPSWFALPLGYIISDGATNHSVLGGEALEKELRMEVARASIPTALATLDATVWRSLSAKNFAAFSSLLEWLNGGDMELASAAALSMKVMPSMDEEMRGRILSSIGQSLREMVDGPIFKDAWLESSKQIFHRS